MVADAYWQLSLKCDKLDSEHNQLRGQCLMRYDGQWRTFRYELFDSVLSLKASVSLVTAYANLGDYERVLIGNSGKGIFVALASRTPASDVIMMFPLDAENDKNSSSRVLYEKLVQFQIKNNI
jgi:hypothetical protein